jgi:glucuronate isomerase
MYRRVLANVLASDFVLARGWTEDQAIQLGGLVLRGNVERIFSC